MTSKAFVRGTPDHRFFVKKNTYTPTPPHPHTPVTLSYADSFTIEKVDRSETVSPKKTSTIAVGFLVCRIL